MEIDPYLSWGCSGPQVRGVNLISVFTCVTGRVVPLPPAARQSGSTHALLHDDGRVLFLLRSRAVTLDVLAGKTSRVCGLLRGHVLGEAAPLLEVTEGCELSRMPMVPGVDRGAPGACVQSGGLRLRPLIGW